MPLTWEAVKDPDEVKDYSLLWTSMLAGDTIASSSWEVVSGSGLTISSSSHNDTVTTVWLSGGTLNGNYDLRNRVTTTGGRTYDQTVRLNVRAK